jgi:hypothetical protein
MTLAEEPKGLAVRPANLQSVTSCRTEAMKCLSDCLRERFPQKGFKLHPALSFEVDEGGGVCIRTTANVDKGEILLVVPDEVGISNRLAAGSSGLILPNGTSMRHVFDDVARLWGARGNNNWSITCSDTQLAVLLMHVALHPVDELHVHVAGAWPSMEDARSGLPLLMSAERLARMQGTQASRFIARVRDEVDAIFKLIEPALTPYSQFFCKDGDSLRDSFFFGFSLAYSRAHDSTNDSSTGTLRPLIDAINGVPGPHVAINVEVNAGKWPFLRGSLFRNDCNLAVSAVAATRALRAGEELIIDYGACSTTTFLLKYGVVPRQLLPHGTNATDSVECLIPPDLEPPPSDKLRLRAVKEIFGYDGFEIGMGCDLPMRDIGSIGEPVSLKSFRQLCVLLIAEPGDIKAFVDCYGSRFRFNFNGARLGQVLQRCFDHSLELLAPREDEDIIRVIERQRLQAWSMAVLARYGFNGA